VSPVAMSLLLLAGFGVFAVSAYRRWCLLAVATPAARFDRIGRRLAATWRYAFAQERMRRYWWAGVAHLAIFSGFVVLLLRSLILWGRGYSEGFDFWLFGLDQPFGKIYALLKDIFVVLVILGTLVFVYYRAVRKLTRMTLSTEGLIILGIILTMMVSDVLYDGANHVRAAQATGAAVHFNPWEPVGSGVGLALSPWGLSGGAINVLRHLGFWTHAGLVLVFLNILPYSKHFHIITAIPNVFFQDLDPPGRLAPTEDLEGKVEREETLGIARIEQFSWKAVLDFFTCTECGRCTDFCPAANTGKLLSPKQFTIDLRDHLYSRQDEFIAARRNGHSGAAPAKSEGDPSTAAGGSTNGHGIAPVELAPAIINPEVLWACTTCRACEQECPVFISYVDKFVDMRQYLVQEKGEFPNDLATAFRGLEAQGNPWGLPAAQRLEWTEGLEVPRIDDVPDAEYLLWVGCGPAYDEKARKTARAVAQLLNHAGVRYAILGEAESCTGDPARRAGNEFLAQMLMQANVEVLGTHDVKKIITICPHCYNTLKNEYGDFGGHYQVAHHSEVLAKLVAQGKLKPTGRVEAKIAYHDACYLGRHNQVYDPPRAVLANIPGVELVEAEATRDRGMCCGAGGAQFFKEEEPGEERVNVARTGQLLATGADTVASGCPFCMRMLTDGLAAKDRDDVRQMDIAEVLLESVSRRTFH
jgi:Fe-S oxidoreductase